MHKHNSFHLDVVRPTKVVDSVPMVHGIVFSVGHHYIVILLYFHQFIEKKRVWYNLLYAMKEGEVGPSLFTIYYV